MESNVRTTCKTSKMVRREIPNRITQTRVKAFQVLMIVFTFKREEKNMVAQLDQIGIELDRSPGNYAERDIPMAAEVHQVPDRARHPGRLWFYVLVGLIYNE